ncbi:FeoA family protein [Porticoccaceae bacterium LTM1]|nr:FeoA family protein [Porticoccaceae bacterium LTM1]
MTNNSTPLHQLKVGEKAIIDHFNGIDANYRNRLMSLGLTPGTTIELQGVAPLGDPMSLKVRGFKLSLRRAEAGQIHVIKV